MNLEQLKKKVAEINKSTATSHPKVVIAALCVVIQELIVKIENLSRPKITLTSPEQIVPIDTPPLRTPPLLRPKSNPGSPYEPSRVPRKRFNAGDAK